MAARECSRNMEMWHTGTWLIGTVVIVRWLELISEVFSNFEDSTMVNFFCLFVCLISKSKNKMAFWFMMILQVSSLGRDFGDVFLCFFFQNYTVVKTVLKKLFAHRKSLSSSQWKDKRFDKALRSWGRLRLYWKKIKKNNFTALHYQCTNTN